MAKERSTCSICRKKRYRSLLVALPYLETTIYYNNALKCWVCKSCLDSHLKKLSVQVGLLQKMISYVSTRVDTIEKCSLTKKSI